MKNNKEQKKPSLTSQFFHDYTVQVSKEMIRKYAGPYESYEKMGNYWRNELPYKLAIENDLVENAKLFIRTLPTNNGIGTNLKLLRPLIKAISDYLSGYTARSTRFANRKMAQNAMFDRLFTNSSYIQRLIESQQAKHEFEQHRYSKEFYQERKRIARRVQAEYDRIVANQVQSVFDEAQRTPRKR